MSPVETSESFHPISLQQDLSSFENWSSHVQNLQEYIALYEVLQNGPIQLFRLSLDNILHRARNSIYPPEWIIETNKNYAKLYYPKYRRLQGEIQSDTFSERLTPSRVVRIEDIEPYVRVANVWSSCIAEVLLADFVGEYYQAKVAPFGSTVWAAVTREYMFPDDDIKRHSDVDSLVIVSSGDYDAVLKHLNRKLSDPDVLNIIAKYFAEHLPRDTLVKINNGYASIPDVFDVFLMGVSSQEKVETIAYSSLQVRWNGETSVGVMK